MKCFLDPILFYLEKVSLYMRYFKKLFMYQECASAYI